MTDASTTPKRVAMPVGVIVRQRPGVTRWARIAWQATGVLPGARPGKWKELRRDGDTVEFHAATAELELHRAEAEGYATALAAEPPVLWVILRHPEGDTTRRPDVVAVTASAYLAQDFCDNGEDIVEPIIMPEPVRAWVGAFVAAHFTPEEFRKRKRRPHYAPHAENGIGDSRIRQAADVYRAPAAFKGPRR